MSDTTKGRILRTEPFSHSRWRELVFDSGEVMQGVEPVHKEAIACFIHLSDIHICDAASPARLEFLDRIADPDSPFVALIPLVGTYRAQEFLTTQVFESMIAAANQISRGPLTGTPVDAVVITGDVVDNAQENELTWYKTILEGGLVQPKSGDALLSEGFHSSNPGSYDIHYYHPDGPRDDQEADRPHQLHQFPHFPGLLAASEREFHAEGLRHTWLAVHGNHDALLQGTARPTPELDHFAQGAQKLSKLKESYDLPSLFSSFGEIGPALYPDLSELETLPVTSDRRRRLISLEDWVRLHTECGHNHGLDNEQPATAYWYRDINPMVRLIALDTVNKFGGWQGCIHREQFEWLADMLEHSRDKYVILTSHHPLQNLFNGYHPEGEEPPALEDEVNELLIRHPHVILWFAGHVHDHKVSERKRSDGSHAFWEIRTSSHIDWPQQSRVIEIIKAENGQIAIGTVVFDHVGPLTFRGSDREFEDPIALAGFSRMLAANDWQRHSASPFALELLEGEPSDRNIWLWAPDPLAR
ncbi:MAG: hypothetical protein EBT44_03650 [Actinobacteria bacterium]|uniref:Calcineurin-like phosphoesterase domain-containing protein n=1 Tax=Candidatus Fonsibacter lacus TaxID=2576439 RepID=A0A965GD72_9PROT|nr:hypothetical protein [Candidatus Fonsibacter lacus]